MLSMSLAESVVLMWGSSAPAFSSQAAAYDLDRASQARSIRRFTGT
ncbi:MAG: hypothetical protein K0S88_273 [Actinomycetia bacterium]|nr:hypothetical protein [Actinomycetes bacterium]